MSYCMYTSSPVGEGKKGTGHLTGLNDNMYCSSQNNNYTDKNNTYYENTIATITNKMIAACLNVM